MLLNKTRQNRVDKLKSITLLILSLLVSGFTNPDTGDYTKGKEFSGDYTLFRINRSRDADYLVYDVQLDPDGNLDKSNPVKIYWKKQGQEIKSEPLTPIQNKFGYGIKIKDLTPEMAEFQLVSYREQVFRLSRSSDGSFRVYTSSAGCDIEVSSLYIHFEDDSFWFPSVSGIDVSGVDLASGNNVKVNISPGTENPPLKMANH